MQSPLLSYKKTSGVEWEYKINSLKFLKSQKKKIKKLEKTKRKKDESKREKGGREKKKKTRGREKESVFALLLRSIRRL